MRKLPRLNDRKWVNIKSIWTHLRSFNPGALACSNTSIKVRWCTVRSGDKILKIEAILSGTLSYLFNAFMEGKDFSEVVQEAQKKGYTEPDPREDLNGMDIARKLLILVLEKAATL